MQYISNSYCHCNILRSDIKKEQYNSEVIYSIHKSFPTRDKNFKIKNDFKINIFETGSIIDFSWNRSGKRVAPNNKKK